MDGNKTISQVVKDGLCTGCGTCVALCPEEAIEMVINRKKGIYVPELDEDKCSNCGLCYKVCPGHEVDFKTLNLEIFGKEPEDILIGNYLNCYVGHSMDYDIRYNSASGGLVTQLLIFALKEELIDGALVTRMKKDKPLEPEPFIARTKEEIIEARGSKYCPVPANVALKEILEAEEGERFAVVGLPCHLHGIRKAEQINKTLKEKIVLRIGIICNHTPTFLATEFLLKNMKAKKEIKRLNYRGEGWPGGMKIVHKNGDELFIPQKHIFYWGSIFNLFFIPTRCLVCNDKICGLADVSMGDALLPEILNRDKIGSSILVSRSKISEEILKNAATKERTKLNEIKRDKVVQSQALHSFKKRSSACSFIFKKFGKGTPVYNHNQKSNNMNNISAIYYLKAILLYMHSYFSLKRSLWSIIGIYAHLFVFISKIRKLLTRRFWRF